MGYDIVYSLLARKQKPECKEQSDHRVGHDSADVQCHGGVGIWITMRSLNFIEDIADTERGTMQLANAQNALWQLRYSIEQFILYTDKGARDKIVADDAKWYKDIDSDLAAFKAGQRSPEELAALTKLQDVFKKFKHARPQWFKRYHEWKLDEAGEWRSKTLQPLAESTIAELAALI